MRGAPDYEKLCCKKEAREGYRTFASENCFSSRQWYVRNSDNVIVMELLTTHIVTLI